jgi:hypothetical protein
VTGRAMVAVLAVVAATSRVADAQPPATYAREARVAHLSRALDALRALGAEGRKALELALHEGVRAKCRAAGRPPTTACMVEVARAVCGARGGDPAACTAAADVIVTNQHATDDLVDEQTRMRLVRTSSDYHGAVNGELWSRYALLAAELALHDGPGSDAERIDRFCATRDREVHRCAPRAKACLPSVAWQRCAGGLAWYVASHEVTR